MQAWPQNDWTNTARLHEAQSITQRAHFIYFPMIFASRPFAQRALKSGVHHPEKFKMAAKFRAILRLSGGKCLYALAGIKFLASASMHSPPP